MKVLAIISRHGLKLKMSKCEFAKTRVRYLGHVLDGNGIHVDPEKVVAVKNMPSPKKGGGITIVFRYGWLLSSIYFWFCKDCKSTC